MLLKSKIDKRQIDLSKFKFLNRDELLYAQTLLPIEPQTISFEIQCSAAFANLLRHKFINVPRKVFHFKREDFKTTETYIKYDDLLLQFKQIYFDQKIKMGSISYYDENSTYENFREYTVKGFKENGMPMNLKKNNIDINHTFGKLFKGCFIDIKEITIEESDNYNLTMGHTFKQIKDNHYALSFDSYDIDLVIEKAFDSIEKKFNEIKQLSKKTTKLNTLNKNSLNIANRFNGSDNLNTLTIENDSGIYSALIQDYGLKQDIFIKYRRLHFTKEPFVILDGDIDKIDKIIDDILNDLQKIHKKIM